MKNLIVLFIACTFLTFTSCKNEEKKQKEEKTKIEIKETFRVHSEKTTVKWTAYKTTDKTPVSGIFKKIKLDGKEANNPIDALNGLEFYIPISSIFSDNEERDGKLQASFFGTMLDTALLSGALFFDENKMCTASIKMNGVTHNLPLTYSAEENNFTFKGVMNLDDWNASEAIEALNKVCFELHKGADGVSKTWNEVAIEINTTISKQ
tara:strand:- start:23350 stop:23973 length:624 start_codon:yes stop_codon:yes gene_type:complete